MEEFTAEELKTAVESLSSTIRKNKKVYDTLSKKEKPRVSQMKMVEKNIRNLEVMRRLIEQRQRNEEYECSMLEVEEVLGSLPNYRQQIEKVLPKFKEGTPQHTLAIRRLDSYAIVEVLLKEALENLR